MMDLLLRESSPDPFDQVDNIDDTYLWPFLHLLDGAAKPVAKPVKQIAEPVARPTRPIAKPTKKYGSTRLPLRSINANNSAGQFSTELTVPCVLEATYVTQIPDIYCILYTPVTTSEYDSSPCRQPEEPETCIVGKQCRLCNRQNQIGPNNSQVGSSAEAPQRVVRGRRSKHPSEEVTYLDEFFAHYPEFPYNSAAPVVGEFYRMCDFFEWKKPKKVVVHGRLKDAMVEQFNSYYGTDENDISSWRNLCQVLNIFPAPRGLEACRKAVLRVHVNIVDLVDTQKTGRPVEIFDTLNELSQYTQATGKIFPREHAYAGGLLKFLLRKIFQSGRSIRGVRRRH